MRSAPDELCARMATQQHGVISDAQALAAGFSKWAIQRRVVAGRFGRDLPGVLSLPGAPITWKRDLSTAVLWAGQESAVSARAAARLHGIGGFNSAPTEISTASSKHGHGLRIRGKVPMVVHRVDQHLVSEIQRIDGIPTTSMRRTLLDLAGIGHPRTEIALDLALSKRLTDLEQVWLLLEKEWIRGRRGVRKLRDLMIPRTLGQAPSESDLEFMLRKLIDDAGLPSPIHQHPVPLTNATVHIDVAYPQARLALETDGYVFHIDRRTFETDRARDNELRALGWTVFRFTWAMLRFDGAKVIAMIRSHLDEHLPSVHQDALTAP